MVLSSQLEIDHMISQQPTTRTDVDQLEHSLKIIVNFTKECPSSLLNPSEIRTCNFGHVS